MDRTHVMNTYVMLGVPSVRKEAKCLVETDSGQAALEWAVREAWNGTAQPRWAGQGRYWKSRGKRAPGGGCRRCRPEAGNQGMGKTCFWAIGL